MTLLVVDPDANSSNSLTRALKRCGVVADFVDRSGASAHLRMNQATLVLVSAIENTGPALDLCQQLTDKYSGIPLVLLAPLKSLDKADLLRILSLHLEDTLEWPLSDDMLVQSIQALLHRLRGSKKDAAQLSELERDQRAGHYIQSRMLPPSPMAIDGYRLCHKLYPSLMLSGDFIDYFRIAKSHLIFYMADVSGHGASSAFVTVLLKNFSRRLRREYHPHQLNEPGEILSWLNQELLENRIDKHVSMLLGVIDISTDQLTLVNAGHYPQPILVTESGARFLESRGKPVGLFQDVSYEAASSTLIGNDQLLLVSDGIMEILPPKRLREKEQLLLETALEACSRGALFWELLDIEQALPAPDDISCLTVSRVFES